MTLPIPFHVIIPARYAATRLPGKMLADLGGKPLVYRTYERAVQSGAETVVVAVDDHRIATVLESLGARTCMTDEAHTSGTERLAEVVNRMALPDETIVVNVQGDEPFVPVSAIHKAVQGLIDNPRIQVSTLCTPLLDKGQFFDPNTVKVILNSRQEALYFSRAPIPWNRDHQGFLGSASESFRHIGLYACRAKLLKQFVTWSPSPLEQLECLEQLRVLHHGERIGVTIVNESLPPGIDVQRDLDRAREHYLSEVS